MLKNYKNRVATEFRPAIAGRFFKLIDLKNTSGDRLATARVNITCENSSGQTVANMSLTRGSEFKTSERFEKVVITNETSEQVVDIEFIAGDGDFDEPASQTDVNVTNSTLDVEVVSDPTPRTMIANIRTVAMNSSYIVPYSDTRKKIVVFVDGENGSIGDNLAVMRSFPNGSFLELEYGGTLRLEAGASSCSFTVWEFF